MPILIDQLNVNAKVRDERQSSRKQPESPATSTPASSPVVAELMQRALDAKRW